MTTKTDSVFTDTLYCPCDICQLAGTNYDTFIHQILRNSGWEGRP